MRVLFITEELGASELALVLKSEGNDVKLCIINKRVQDCYAGLVEKIDDWESELDWVGKDGLIVFDDVGFGKQQKTLRSDGYRVIGGSEMGDRIEEDRAYGQKILEENGITALPCYNFIDPKDAILFIREHPESIWVVKKNGGHISNFSYVTGLQSQEDAISILEQYSRLGITDINLQKKVSGVEIGIARYFNGTDWVGPIEFNIEHKGLMVGDIGPKTPEMGTLMWYEKDEQNALFCATLAKLKSYLQKIDFRGDIDINCIVSEKEIWPLEFTARFGNPSTALQIELHNSPWIEFLSAVADGTSYDLDYKVGMGITVTLAVPPFPYHTEEKIIENSVGYSIIFSDAVDGAELRHYQFEEMSLAQYGRYVVAGAHGCVMHVNGFGKNIGEARSAVYARIQNVHVPKMFYRLDIGTNFDTVGHLLLKKWGWL